MIRFSEIQINNINDYYYHQLYDCFDFIEFIKKRSKINLFYWKREKGDVKVNIMDIDEYIYLYSSKSGQLFINDKGIAE